ncbi:MAG TPA: hypothetical protein VN698_08075 [Bacteroidia bacterium]|nr:hypothetical protein [Bacteroidia bacterium]
MSFTKHFLLSCFLLVLIAVKGQIAFVEIYGNVKDKYENRNLEEIFVDFEINDSLVIRTKTDTLGNYSLVVSKKAITKWSKLSFYQDYKAYRKKYIKDTTCSILPLS